MNNLVELLEEEILRYINSKPKNELAYDYGYIHGLRKAKEIVEKNLRIPNTAYTCPQCGGRNGWHLPECASWLANPPL